MEAPIPPPLGMSTGAGLGLVSLSFLLRVSHCSAWKGALPQCLGIYTPLTEVQNSPQAAALSQENAQLPVRLETASFNFLFCNSMHLCVSVWGFVHVNTVNCGGQKGTLNPLELESRAVVSHPAWMSATMFGSSARMVCTLNL